MKIRFCPYGGGMLILEKGIEKACMCGCNMIYSLPRKSAIRGEEGISMRPQCIEQSVA